MAHMMRKGHYREQDSLQSKLIGAYDEEGTFQGTGFFAKQTKWCMMMRKGHYREQAGYVKFEEKRG